MDSPPSEPGLDKSGSNPENMDGMGEQPNHIETANGWSLDRRRDVRLRRLLAKERCRQRRHLRHYRPGRDDAVLAAVAMISAGVVALGLAIAALVRELGGEDA